MVQVAFAVVMARDGVWATVLEEQAAAVGTAFPQWSEAARRPAEQGRRPVADAGVVRGLLDGFGRWAEDELDRAVSGASNLEIEHGDEGKELCRAPYKAPAPGGLLAAAGAGQQKRQRLRG